MSKKLFIIAAFSVASLISAELLAAEWYYGVLHYEPNPRQTAPRLHHVLRRADSWFGTDGPPARWSKKAVANNGVFYLEDALADIGREGWELVQVTQLGKVTTMYFKRPR